jgi:hypothetical protein
MTKKHYNKLLCDAADFALTLNGGRNKEIVDKYTRMINDQIRAGSKRIAIELLTELAWKMGFEAVNGNNRRGKNEN